MKILHVVPTYVPAWIYGGPILSIHNLCVEQIKYGHEVTVYTTNLCGKNYVEQKNNDQNLKIINGVKVYYFRCNIKKIYFSFPMMNKLNETIKSFDIVHLHSIFLWPTTYAAILCRKFNVPYILTPRGMLVKNLITKNFLIKNLWILIFEQKNLIQASAIQVSTNYEYKEIRRFNFFFPKIFIIPNGVINPAYFKYPKERKVLFKKKYKNILFIGRLNWKKNIDILIKSMVNLEDFFLTIIGNDEDNYKNKLLELTNKLKIKSRVRIISERRGPVKEYLLKKCDLFILPSKSENFGNSVLDALKYKKIVAITKEVGISSLIIKYKCGIIITPNPTTMPLVLKKYLYDKKKLKSLRVNSTKLIKENFNWRIIIQKTNYMYEYAKAKK